ncbi:MAG: hypothetical protein Q8M51_15230 [Polaromonas sp.]|nr:hypothetical protein [Polaromonas sp.]MDP3750576.1 hypothetical protein [Polaromonas sp.]
MTQTYISAIRRLSELAEVFTGRDLTVKFQWSGVTASSYLANWRKAGLIRSLGGHSDVHLNLVKNRNPNLEAALRRALPEACKIGVDVLREAGWTTQIVAQPEVAILPSSPSYKLEDFQLVVRSAVWFARVAPGTQDPHDAAKRLLPAWALADMLARASDRRVRKAWLLAPDDLDLTAAQQDPQMQEALTAFNLAAEIVFEPDYARLYDDFQQGLV